VTCDSHQGTPDGLACSGSGPNPQFVDIRAYNLFSYKLNTSAAAWSLNTDDSGRPIYGAFYRIHTNQSMNLPNNSGPVRTSVCTYADATQQVGCLVQASPCSFGFGGRTILFVPGPSPSIVPVGLDLLGDPPSRLCIQSFDYALSGKLYLNTMLGFGNLDAGSPEFALANCEKDPARISQAVGFRGFVDLPNLGPNADPANGANLGAPLCESFDEQQQCGLRLDAGPSNHCATNPPGFPTNGTSCGNGVIEAFEQCDDGVAGTSTQRAGTPGNTNAANPDGGNWCTKSCRLGK
jgi:hypothetical protein